MLILRFTTKAFKKFSKKPQLIEVDKTEKDFGEWYVNTVDSANRGNLFMLVVHAESLYSILVPVEDMDLTNFVHNIFANMLLRLLRLEVPHENAKKIMATYDSQTIYAKTNSRSLVASLSTVIKDIDAIMEWPEKYVKKSNTLDLVHMEHQINDAPRGLGGVTIWPIDEFYQCIRRFCPELPVRKTLPLHYSSMSNPQILIDLCERQLSEHLALKAKACVLEAEVLFDVEETRAILKAVEDSQNKLPEQLYTSLHRMLSFQIRKREEEATLK